MAINNLPLLDRTSPTFRADVDALFNGQLNTVIGQMNALGLDASTALAAQSAAQTAASSAASSAATAAQVVGAVPWVSGKTYALNECAISQLNFQTYRRSVAGAGATDPANDPANWRVLAGNGAFVPVPVTGTSVDLSKGNYFTASVNGSVNFSFDNCPAGGYSFTLELTHVGGSIGFPTSVKTPNNASRPLTAGKTHLFMFVTVNGGVRWRLAAASNYDN